jgi:hypothetical protein
MKANQQRRATMAEQQIPLTYEGIGKMVRNVVRKSNRESRRAFDQEMKESRREFDLRMQKLDQQIEKTSQEVGALGSSIGRVVEHMVAGNIVAKLQDAVKDMSFMTVRVWALVVRLTYC